MAISLSAPRTTELKPRIVVFGVGGAGGNAVNNMIESGLEGVEFVVANTDAQQLQFSKTERRIQLGVQVTQGLGAGAHPEVGMSAAEESAIEIGEHLDGAHMVFITAGMGGGTGTGAAPIIAKCARERGILTVGVVTKPFQFEGSRRMRLAEAGIQDLQESVDTLIVIPNQNLFRIANDRTTFADAFAMADQVLYSGVACITDLMVKEGLINLDFADVRSIMRGMGKAMMGTGESSGEGRALQAAEAAIANPLLDEVSMRGAQGLLISITGGRDMTLFEVDEAATRIREEVDEEAMIILGATFDDSLEGLIRVSVVATGIDAGANADFKVGEQKMAELSEKLRTIGNNKPAAQVAAAEARPTPAVPRVTPQPLSQIAPAPVAAAPEPPRAVPAAQDPGVMIEPYQNGSGGYVPEDVYAHEEVHPGYDAEPAPQPYVPPAAERPQAQRARMPRVEDFPAIAQRELRGGQAHDDHDDKRPMGLLRRLANASLGRRDELEGQAPAHREPAAAPRVPQQARAPQPRPVQQQAPQPQPAPRAPQPAPAPVARAPQPQTAPRIAQPARAPQPQRAPQGALDPQGRPAPAPARASVDDELEIPAFLRRQAN